MSEQIWRLREALERQQQATQVWKEKAEAYQRDRDRMQLILRNELEERDCSEPCVFSTHELKCETHVCSLVRDEWDNFICPKSGTVKKRKEV